MTHQPTHGERPGAAPVPATVAEGREAVRDTRAAINLPALASRRGRPARAGSTSDVEQDLRWSAHPSHRHLFADEELAYRLAVWTQQVAR